MLNILRHKGVSRKVLWFIAVIIILSFGVFGTAYRLDTTINSAGKIYGQSVSLRDFQRAYMDARDQAIITYGDRFFKMGQMIDLEREAWSRLILQREAKRRGVKVDDKDVVGFIASLPFFQREGRFDRMLYENIVRNQSIFQRTPKDFESGVRGTLMIRKMLDAAAPAPVLSEEALRKEYVLRNERITLSYVLYSPDDFSKGITTSKEEAQKFYDEHKEEFRQPPMINVEYIHLLYPDKATDDQKKEVRKQAAAAFREFDKQAPKESGFFAQDRPLLTFAWSPELVEKLFAMKEGEIAQPAEAPDGMQVIRIKQKKASAIPEFAEIEDAVKNSLTLYKALDEAKKKAALDRTQIAEALKTKKFPEAASALKLKVLQTEPFARGEYINAPGLTAQLQQESLSLSDSNRLGGIIETSQGPVLVYLSETAPIDEQKYKDDREDFLQMTTARLQSEAMAAFVNKLKLEAKLQSEIKDKVRYR